MVFLLLILYVVLFGYWIKNANFFNLEQLSRPFIFFIFMTKLGVGFLYAAIHQTYFQSADTFFYLADAISISNTILEYPEYYISSLLGGTANLPPDQSVFIYPPDAIFWKDLGTYVIVHWHAFINFFAFDSYEIHLFFVAIFGLYASINFYKIFHQCLALPSPILIGVCFFVPSITFWTSGLHKDIYIYLGLSFLAKGLFRLQKATHKKALLNIFLGLFIISLFRHYLITLLIPAIIAYLISLNSTRKPWQLYLSTYTVCALLGSVIAQGIIGLDLLDILAHQQSLFFAEKGGSTLANIDPMQANFWSILMMLPVAISNVLGRPFLWECTDFLQIIAAIEILCFTGLVIATLLFRKPQTTIPNPIINFIVAYAIANLLLIGLLVINVGTIARYRSISLGLLTIVLTQILDFYKLGIPKSGRIIPIKKKPLEKSNSA